MREGMRVLAASVVLLTACQEVSGPMDADSNRADPVALDQVTLGRQLPTFGGLFLDETGRPNVYVTDPRDEGLIRSRLAAFAHERGFDAADIRVLRGEFSFARLTQAFERATHAAMPLAGSVFTDLDEARNRIVVGVERESLITGARAALAAAGLEDGSFEVIVTEPIHQVATLRDRFSPTVGGIQIHFSQYVCTLGANVYDGTERSFLTNSHCTSKQGGVEGTVYYQPTSSVDGTVIATEVEDPKYFKGGACPRGKQCRYSDSARALYSNARSSTLGAMAITGSVNTGSLEVTGTRTIVGKGYSLIAGQTVNKVGRTTGWTQAPISRTCVNTGVSGSNIMQLCQHWVQSSTSTIVAGGDSGSTVWTGSSSITIVGLLWGGSSDNRTFIFSPIAQVEQELGTLAFN